MDVIDLKAESTEHFQGRPLSAVLLEGKAHNAQGS